jgi:hypothetical protein
LSVLLGLLALSLGGCAGPQPPKSSAPTNAVLDGYRPIYTDTIPYSADVILVASLYGVDPSFQKTTIDNEVYDWSFDMFAVVKVEKGDWDSPSLAFLTLETSRLDSSSSVRESPYRYGVQIRFWLDTHSNPARIVGQQVIQ